MSAASDEAAPGASATAIDATAVRIIDRETFRAGARPRPAGPALLRNTSARTLRLRVRTRCRARVPAAPRVRGVYRTRGYRSCRRRERTRTSRRVATRRAQRPAERV